MKMKELGTWIGIIVVLLATLWGLITLANNSNSTSNSTTQTGTPAPISNQDITLGATNSAKVTLIEYADFQCPACKTTSNFLSRAVTDFKGKVQVAYRFFPLVNSHQNAMTSAQAAFAAYKQNKFWEMDELLYQNQETWAVMNNPQRTFTDYAKKLNLNINQFTKDYSSDATKKFINAQENEGLKIGITFTPSFFINGKLIENLLDYQILKQAIQDKINGK
jgi:protein-disulfide isomerase